MQKAIPQAQFHPIEKAGHLPHMERTDVVLKPISWRWPVLYGVLTLAAGAIFGLVRGTVYTLIGATLGASAVAGFERGCGLGSRGPVASSVRPEGAASKAALPPPTTTTGTVSVLIRFVQGRCVQRSDSGKTTTGLNPIR